MDNDDLRIRNEQLEEENKVFISNRLRVINERFMSPESGMVFLEDKQGNKFQAIFIADTNTGEKEVKKYGQDNSNN
jgi:hypothetical protein